MLAHRHALALVAVLVLVTAACGSSNGETEAAFNVAADQSTSDGTTTDGTADDGDTDDAAESSESPSLSSETVAPAPEEPQALVDSADCISEDHLCVGLVTAMGAVDDNAFNQAAWEGVQTSTADESDVIENTDAADHSANIQALIDRDYDVIITVGADIGEATIAAARTNSEVRFIGVDQAQNVTVPNLAGLVFAEDEAGFLAGALAGLMTESGTVAAVFGTDLVPSVEELREGFERGARYTNQDVELLSRFHPGSPDDAFSDPEWGAATARQVMNAGADVVFGAGGLTGVGALSEAASEGGDVFCIGVDIDRWDTVPEARPCLVTSAVKLVTPGVAELIDDARNEDLASGETIGAVGLADFRSFGAVIAQEVQDEVADLTVRIADGDIPTAGE